MVASSGVNRKGIIRSNFLSAKIVQLYKAYEGISNVNEFQYIDIVLRHNIRKSDSPQWPIISVNVVAVENNEQYFSNLN